MTGETIKVRGADRVASTMRHASDQLGHMDGANRRVAAGIAQQARARAPRRSGALARSTTGKAGANNSAEIEATVIYAGVIHEGWPRHHIRAQPYIRQTVESTQAQWLNAYEREVDKITDNVRGA
jgi:hypothetical protein